MQTIFLILYQEKMRRLEPAHVPRQDPAPPFWTWFIENPRPRPPDETPPPKSDDPDQL